MTAQATMANGITAFMDEYHGMMTKFLPTIGCGSTDTDKIMSAIIESSYINVINHIVKCEVIRIGKVAIDRNMQVKITNSEVQFSLDTISLNWNISLSSGIAANVVKVENQIVSTPAVATKFLALNSLMASGTPDMLEYIKARVAYILALVTATPPAMAELEAEIKRVKQEAA